MKIAVLLSGGVDSSVSLCELVAENRHEIEAYYLKIWLEDEFQFLGHCPWQEDLEYARAVCDQFNIPLKIVSLQKEYWERVVSETISELKKGYTPSPDILCNQRVKYGAFADYIDTSYDKIASGHYASIGEKDDLYWLKKGIDPVKDQTYFLSHLSQRQLSRCLFPIGNYPKAKVRQLASYYHLPNKDRRDSQGICFLGKIKYNDFVKAHLGEKPGQIIEKTSGRHLGSHKGYWFHTIGQRKGLGLGGGPWFVVGKDVTKNIIYVSASLEIEERGRNEFLTSAVNWISNVPVDHHCDVKLRHGAQVTKCCLYPEAQGLWRVVMEKPDAGVAGGQYAVFYSGETCLGGGVIQIEAK